MIRQKHPEDNFHLTKMLELLGGYFGTEGRHVHVKEHFGGKQLSGCRIIKKSRHLVIFDHGIL